tara:strand:+ start:327 stop:749 length:423 start_codon:yes stop_codon:yes gene_type:complete
MANLPIDCILYIVGFNELYNSEYHLINKRFNKVFDKKNFINSSNKIKRWYYNNTFPYLNDENLKLNNMSKINTIQYYRKYFPMKTLLHYPEFFSKKLNRHGLREYIRNNMSNISNRTKKEVIDFLKLTNISTDELFYVGW